MNTTTSTPYDWIGKVDPHLLQIDEIPLLGNPPSFPWEKLSQKLSEVFEIEDVALTAENPKWRTPEELLSDLGDHLAPLALSAPEFEGQIHWLMAKEDIAFLMSSLLNQKESPPLQDINEDFQEGFYRFLAIETINLINELGYDDAISPHLIENHTLPNESSLCVDIKIQLFKHTIWSRLVISPAFRKSWKDHFSTQKSINESPQLAEAADVTIGVEAGRVRMSFNEWKKIKTGDFLLLGRADYSPSEQQGLVFLTLMQKPLLCAKLKKGSIKILGPAEQYEEELPMDKNMNDDFDDEFDEDSDMEEESEYEDDDETSEYDEDDDVEEESEYEEEEEEPQEEEEEVETAKEETEAVAEPLKEPIISPAEIPFSLCIEIGRLQMPMQKLIELQPGNLLELGIPPESGVNLVVNGKCIGKGELIRIGKTLGVRILAVSE